MFGSSELVDIAEHKLHHGKVDFDLLTSIVEPWLEPACSIDTIVLACTHFPLLTIELNEIFIRHNKRIQWIDSAEGVANRVRFLLAKYADENIQSSLFSNQAFFTTKQTISDAFRQYLDSLKIVDIHHLSV